MEALATLIQKVNPHTHKKEYALVSRKTKRVLKWFGATRPSDEAVAKEERRVQYFKHHASLHGFEWTDYPVTSFLLNLTN